jgi:hypothetical protein
MTADCGLHLGVGMDENELQEGDVEEREQQASGWPASGTPNQPARSSMERSSVGISAAEDAPTRTSPGIWTVLGILIVVAILAFLVYRYLI